ncbi:hypothetical protein Ccrd_001105, partial [Cynara cardunculus var. scolymus]
KRSSPNTQKRPLIEGIQDEPLIQKRLRQVSEDEALARRLQNELNDDIHDKKSSGEAICNFKPPKDKLPQTFRLMRVRGLQPWANTSSVSVGDVIQILYPREEAKTKKARTKSYTAVRHSTQHSRLGCRDSGIGRRQQPAALQQQHTVSGEAVTHTGGRRRGTAVS